MVCCEHNDIYIKVKIGHKETRFFKKFRARNFVDFSLGFLTLLFSKNPFTVDLSPEIADPRLKSFLISRPKSLLKWQRVQANFKTCIYLDRNGNPENLRPVEANFDKMSKN